MPIYEFTCKNCGESFEQLCPVNWRGAVTCPNCKADNLEKMISRFNGAGSSSGCGSCSGKNCGSCK
ncbi:rubredoxin-type fold [Lucifera butyrica]|uniref:Rubredoxin-type fold n=1 Tax=Lucifera butyrica TaxID=1351585 RepID=A0A498R3D6_9FIRM|nr:zinc ribbon domain-containing protein [Lucifera butyrica]VBB05675.1 rubredoxin-type fold [Lucifera butyrica]